MANAVGVSRSPVNRVWQAYGLKPHLVKTSKVSNDPQFFEKLPAIETASSFSRHAGRDRVWHFDRGAGQHGHRQVGAPPTSCLHRCSFDVRLEQAAVI